MKKNPLSNPEQPATVVLFGASFYTGNRGVSALAASAINLISEGNPAIRVVVAYPGQNRKVVSKTTHEEITYAFHPFSRIQSNAFLIGAWSVVFRIIRNQKIRSEIRRWFPMIDVITESLFIGDIWGGDSFSDIYGVGRMIKRSYGSLLSLIIGKKLVLLPQTYGPYKTFIARRLARFIVNHAYRVYARTNDTKWLDTLGLKKVVPVFCPDVAFTLPAILPRIEPLPRFLTKKPDDEIWIGINVSGLLYAGGYRGNNMFSLELDYRNFVVELTKQILSEKNHHVFFFPHTYGTASTKNTEDDLSAATEIFVELQSTLTANRLNVVNYHVDQHEIKYVIGTMDFFIGSRLHSCIAAVSQGIPTIGVSYSHKFYDVFGSIGLEEFVVDGTLTNTSEAIVVIQKAIQNRETVKRRIRTAVIDAKYAVHSCFQELRTEKWDSSHEH